MADNIPGKTSRSGRWEKQPGPEPYYCFLPAPLPPDPPIRYDAKLQTLTEKASRALGRLDSITAHLPAHVRDGMRLRLRGQGAPAPGGGQPGDLFVRVRLLPHPLFKVSGADLETAVTVAPWDAALGGEIMVPSLEGPIRIKIPAGTRAGRRLRIAGKGLRKEDGSRGDLYAATRLDIPERTDARMAKLYEQMREAAR